MTEKQVERASRIASLIIKRMQGVLTAAEGAELEAWLNEDGQNYLMFEEMMDADRLMEGIEELKKVDTEAALDRFQKRVAHMENALTMPFIRHRNRVRLLTFLVAAVVVLTIGIVLYFTTGRPKTTLHDSLVNRQAIPQSIHPGTSKAVLTLANGNNIELNRSLTGTLAVEDGSELVNQNGELAYRLKSPGEAINNTINTLTTPKGGEYKIALDDGTIVWLNASSSLHYPARFSGKERRVVLSGEAYFQVVHDKNRPFFVTIAAEPDGSGGTEIEDLGTEFNVRAYSEDHHEEATLVKGSVKLTQSGNSSLLEPGSMAVIEAGNKVSVMTADLDQITAWKKGEFSFNHTPLKEVMNQLGRWYDLEITYKGKIPDSHFSGGFSRTATLELALKRLESTGSMSFSIQGNKITVLPANE